ncbi:LuxR C-terminal-related transcriptional regulator [Gulosibacter molinativorax]|uniref:DNA-binding response regulator n=1 Tax=Gulosibacter molinativorax TaxID=256821 RepID=A0ABT7CAK2_9MICO|nr:response regulator transcription factor [Gulosibacter molinativorax]MDJ1372169.1 DNA-binding response regulator [Gulosibacter molinativorax]QUY60960.1 Oxygen regulatory protein NreC [Gulosibacter molinativorax]
MRIVICEDNALLRAGLSRLLSDEGHEIVAALPDAIELQDRVTETSPDLVLLDVRLPPTFTDEGVRAAISLREQTPGLPILVLSQYVEERYATELIARSKGALGYLLKDRVADVAEFLDSVEQVADGGTVLDPEVVGQLLGRRSRDSQLDALTERERTVLGLMAEGKSNAAIASQLYISEGSVEKHISQVFQKLGLGAETGGNRRVLAVLAYLGVEIDETGDAR